MAVNPSAVLSAVGNIVAGFGAFQSSRARARALRAAADQARAEGTLAAQMATDEAERTGATAAVRGAAMGGGFGGSFSDVMEDLERTGVFNARSAIYAGAMEARNREYEAKVSKMEGNYALASSALQASSSIGGDLMRGAETRKQQASKRALYRSGKIR